MRNFRLPSRIRGFGAVEDKVRHTVQIAYETSLMTEGFYFVRISSNPDRLGSRNNQILTRNLPFVLSRAEGTSDCYVS